MNKLLPLLSILLLFVGFNARSQNFGPPDEHSSLIHCDLPPAADSTCSENHIGDYYLEVDTVLKKKIKKGFVSDTVWSKKIYFYLYSNKFSLAKNAVFYLYVMKTINEKDGLKKKDSILMQTKPEWSSGWVRYKFRKPGRYWVAAYIGTNFISSCEFMIKPR